MPGSAVRPCITHPLLAISSASVCGTWDDVSFHWRIWRSCQKTRVIPKELSPELSRELSLLLFLCGRLGGQFETQNFPLPTTPPAPGEVTGQGRPRSPKMVQSAEGGK